MASNMKKVQSVITAKLKSIHVEPQKPGEGHLAAALKWVDNYTVDEAGISFTNVQQVAYPEVTGYYIPTLLRWNQTERALQYGRWLVSIQSDDGSWTGTFDDVSYTFDTGQILKGLVALLDTHPEFQEPVERGCEWLYQQITDAGRITTPEQEPAWRRQKRGVPEAFQLYAAIPLRDVGVKWNVERYVNAVDRAVDYYSQDETLTHFKTFSHFHAYIIEALVDLGRTELAQKGMSEVSQHQGADGSVPAYKDVKWVCSTGLIQYAVIWYKLGDVEKADRALAYACGLQNHSGGFFGSYGWGADYFNRQEIGWAVKYFLDAYWLKTRNA